MYARKAHHIGVSVGPEMCIRDSTRALLKANGFRWSPSQGAWQRQLTENGKAAARRVLSSLGE